MYMCTFNCVILYIYLCTCVLLCQSVRDRTAQTGTDREGIVFIQPGISKVQHTEMPKQMTLHIILDGMRHTEMPKQMTLHIILDSIVKSAAYRDAQTNDSATNFLK